MFSSCPLAAFVAGVKDRFRQLLRLLQTSGEF